MQSQNKNFFTSVTGIILITLIVLCGCCLVVLAGGLGGAYFIGSQVTPGDLTSFNFNFNTGGGTPTPFEITRIPPENVSTETLKTIQQSIVPVGDPRDEICRLQGKCNIPETLPSGPFKSGDRQSFWLFNPDTKTHFKIQTSLKYVTEHAYFWVQDGVNYDEGLAKKLVDTFETKIYPTDREFFGSEWTPGVDGDPHIYIVYVSGIGASTAGYFSTPDEYNPQAHKYSNAHEMFVFSAENAPLDDPYTYGTLAHEFQHMIRFHQDMNEVEWENEGLSELAAFLNHYTVGGAPNTYIANPDLQLNDWGPEVGTNGPHYGESFLFFTYFLDRFGEDAIKALGRDQLNGLEDIDNTLKSLKITDKLSGKPIRAEDVFMDWAVANYLQDGSVGDGRYVYHNFSQAPQAQATDTVSDCPATLSRTVHQFGVDYIHFDCGGTHTLRFEGSTTARLLPVEAHSGKMDFWSNKGDSSDMTLTHEFDFTKASGPLTLGFRTWYDVEKDYDYVYLEASTDAGKTWEILKTPSGTGTDPTGGSLGWGYTGQTNGWLDEQVDLSRFKGQDVLIRFEYITDGAYYGEGFLLDDISIPAINYSTDFESSDGGWQSQGFVRVDDTLPQQFRVMLINQHGQTSVQTVNLGADQTAELNLDLTDATLVVSGVTRFTRDSGYYTITVK